MPDNPPLERTAAAVYFTCGRASRVRRRGRSTASRHPTEANWPQCFERLVPTSTWTRSSPRATGTLRRFSIAALLPKTQPDGRKHTESGLNVVVSDAGFQEFAEQVEDAIEFLTDSAFEVRQLVAYPGVTGVVLDFGIAWRDVVAQSDQFPAELVRLAGGCGIALELSHYPVRSGDAPAE
jgi:hypothetical protein